MGDAQQHTMYQRTILERLYHLLNNTSIHVAELIAIKLAIESLTGVQPKWKRCR